MKFAALRRSAATSGVLAVVVILCGCAEWLRTDAHNQPAPKPGPGVFFVATNGSDAWSGSVASLRANDGPFASVARALQAARDFRRSAGRGGAATSIWVRGGTYFLKAPLVLTAEDSGLTLAAFPKEQPVLSGGRAISGWSEVQMNSRPVWMAEVSWVREGGWFFRELWVNGHRAVRARKPNFGYMKVVEAPDAKPDVPWHQGQSRFRVAPEDFPALQHPEDAEVLVMTRWVESRLPLAKTDPAERMLLFSKRSTYKLDPGDLWYAEGAAEFLDAPGEWFLDRRAGRLYYTPLPGETLACAEVIAPVLESLLQFEGRPEANQFISNVTLRGLTFAHAEYRLPSDAKTAQAAAMTWPAPINEIGGFGQAAVGVPGAVRGDGVRGCRFEDCRFVHLGSYGLELGRGCQSNVVSRCELADLGGGGIKLGETEIRKDAAQQTGANEITDCHFHHGGRTFHSAIGIWIGQSPNNRISHNLIHDFYYTGISIGWTWGYGPSLASNNVVEFNHVHHIGVQSDGDGPILSDLGGIYTLGTRPGTRIINNLWHDMAGFRYGGWGIYFDEGTSSTLAESNVVFNTAHGSFHQHYGATNIVRNNLLLFSREGQVVRSREEEHVSFSFSNNVVVFNQGTLLSGTWKNDRFIMENNLYWNVGLEGIPGQLKLAGTKLEAWRQRGHDRRSLVEDPQFVALGQDDFRLKPTSPAFRVGFQPIDLSSVGPRVPAAKRRMWPVCSCGR